MNVFFLTMLLVFSIVKPAVAWGIAGLMVIYTSLQLRRVRRLSPAYVDRQARGSHSRHPQQP